MSIRSCKVENTFCFMCILNVSIKTDAPVFDVGTSYNIWSKVLK